jgi:DNA repair protein RecN (Recombination protein N)
MLALEVALASADPVPTFVFDEVDAGVGGKAAIEVGRRLARLGHHAQVIVVTHLPQVAAFAAQQILVEKGVTAEVSKADVRLLSEAERVAELSRMLAGVGESQAAQQHAQELLEMGARERAGLVHS